MPRIAIITMVQRKDLPWAYAGLGSIARLKGAADLRLALVNDECDPETAKKLREASGAEVILAERNLGVAGGRNRLVREAAARGADHILSLDDDILLPEDFAEIMLGEFLALKKAGANPGILTPATLDYGTVKSRLYDKEDIAALDRGEARYMPHTQDALARLGLISPEDIYHMGVRDWRGAYCFTEAPQDHHIRGLFGVRAPRHAGGDANLKRAEEAPELISNRAQPIEVDTAPGGVCFYSVELFERLGGICETFNPFGYEDADFALRARALGARNFCVPRAIAIHDIAGRLSERPLVALMAAQGKMAGAFASRHLKGRESAAAMFCITRRVANLFSRPADANKTGRFASLNGLQAMLAFVGNALCYSLPDMRGAAPPSEEALRASVEKLAAMAPGGSTPAFVAEVAASDERARIKFRDFVIRAPKTLTPPVIAALTAGNTVELRFKGQLELGRDGAFRLDLEEGVAQGGLLFSGYVEGVRPESKADGVGAIVITDGRIKVEDRGALPRYLRFFAEMEDQTPAGYVDALEEAYRATAGKALFDWLRGASDKFMISINGVIDGAPGALNLSAATGPAAQLQPNAAVMALMNAHGETGAKPAQSGRYKAGVKSKMTGALSRLFAEDPKVAPFPDAYNPPALLKFARKLRYISAGRGMALAANEARFLKFHNYAQGKRAFIIGNGPSLNKLDLTLLKDEFTFGVNAIYLNKERMGFLPTHYIVEDVFVAEDRAPEIEALKGPTKWIGNYLRYCLEGDDDVCWMNVACDYREYPGFPHFSTNAARIVWVGGTVSYIAMQLAYYMGFSEVYLIGFDHSYIVPKEAHVEGRAITSTTDDPNHFHPGYFGKGYRWHDPRVDRMEIAYGKARQAYEAAGRKIYNATAGGHLETFERVDYATLFSKAAA